MWATLACVQLSLYLGQVLCAFANTCIHFDQTQIHVQVFLWPINTSSTQVLSIFSLMLNFCKLHLTCKSVWRPAFQVCVAIYYFQTCDEMPLYLFLAQEFVTVPNFIATQILRAWTIF